MGASKRSRKREAKASRDLARRRGKPRESYERILIICEGEKTEPNYFKGLKDELKLATANVAIVGDGKFNPMKIASFAKKRYQQEKGAGIPFDRVFCVFDKDCHSDYEKALTHIRQMPPRDVFRAIPSVPCFEYFLLLHYRDATEPLDSQQALSALKQYIANYRKGDKNIFSVVRDRLETAKTNAENSLAEAEKTGSDGPSTKAHELVQYMQDLKEKRKTP